MTMSRDGLEHLSAYFDALLADLSPARRKVVARKIGMRLRRLNARRIAANVEPDGGAMEARKSRARQQKHRPGRGRRMFREIAKARNLRVRPSPDGVELAFPGAIGRVAAEHHFGLEGYVGKTRAGRTIRARYPARRLLGFGPEDLDAVADEVLAWLDRD
ncbi:MAG TPA: phage virion morphogenesis protein [Croceibacterium sp.]|nr:phage virion morphogenesis protein [Croceibacterium sp.]